MTFQELKENIKIDFPAGKVNGVEVSSEIVISTFYARIWRSAIVNKNKRESDKGGIKATINQALNEGLIDKEEAFDIFNDGDKERVKELKAQLPAVEKSVEPNDDDVAKAIKQVTENKGQAS